MSSMIHMTRELYQTSSNKNYNLLGRMVHVALFTVVFFQCSFQPFYLIDYNRLKRLDIPVDIVTLTRKRHEAVFPAVSLAVYTI